MSDDFKKSLKRMEQFQRRMTKLYEPLMTQSQIWTQQLNASMGTFNNTMAVQINTIERSLSPVIEALNNQKAFIDQQIGINSPSFENIRKLQLSMDQLVNSQLWNLNDLIPESFYSSLNDLTLELDNFNHFSEDNQEIPNEITVRETLVTQDKKMTWAELINIAFIIWSVIFTYYSDQTSSIQRDKQILEAETQTELLERQVEAIKEQTEAIKEQTKFEQERYEQQQHFEEKFNTFIESLEPYITDQLPVDND
ncbi:hypothetical protein ABFY60_15710 [Lysinibacillus pakistanensis]|uniref:hypothetical protein n=1 Tax=Lysinibacillus pakistanensis TaxID=759811 RepID=UPI003D2E4F2D